MVMCKQVCDRKAPPPPSVLLAPHVLAFKHRFRLVRHVAAMLDEHCSDRVCFMDTLAVAGSEDTATAVMNRLTLLC